MAASKSITVYFQHICSPVNRKTNLAGEMLGLENKYRKKHTRTVASYNEHSGTQTFLEPHKPTSRTSLLKVFTLYRQLIFVSFVKQHCFRAVMCLPSSRFMNSWLSSFSPVRTFRDFSITWERSPGNKQFQVTELFNKRNFH